VAHKSDAGIKAENDDTVVAYIPPEPVLTTKGAVLLIADGVSSAEMGRQASEICGREFVQDYYHTPELWSVKTSVQNTLAALNRKLYKKNQAFQDPTRGYATTLTLIVVKSRTAHIFHVGDSRAYLLREKNLNLLTRDHSATSKDSVALTRAMGIALELQIDYRAETLQEGDIFLLTTDGVHDFLSEGVVSEIIEKSSDNLDEASHKLCKQALLAGSYDNVSCLLLDITELPGQEIDELKRLLEPLSFPPPLSPGYIVDGYRVERELYASTRSQVYLVSDEETGKWLAMKTPSINFDYDQAYIERFCLEEWVGRRINNQHVIRVISPHRPKSFLYYLMEYVEGESLRKWMDNNPNPTGGKVLKIIRQIADGVTALHEKEIIHRDIKPENILITPDEEIKIVDLGSIFIASIAEIQSAINQHELLGTISYTAPEYRLGQAIDTRIDQFSIATIVYIMLTGQFPYGNAFAKCKHAKDFKKLCYQLSFKYNESIPVWFDGAIRKAASIDPADRYDQLENFITDLSTPNAYYLSDDYLHTLEESLLSINVVWALGMLWGCSLLVAILVFVL